MSLVSRGRRALVALAVAVAVLGSVPALPVSGKGPAATRAAETHAAVQTGATVDLPLVASHVAVHWAGNPHAHVTVSFSSDGETFGTATPVVLDEAGRGTDTETYGSVMPAAGARALRIATDRPLGRVTVVVIDSNIQDGSSGSVASAAVAQPDVISRAGWGADESLRFDTSGAELWTPEFYPIQKLIVHHTAGKNADTNPAATIRAIYYYHAVTRGWGDIGYNFLIDESGRVYEGRYSRPYASGEIPTGEDASGRGVTAAHAAGYNSGTVGVALLGTLTNQDATPAARSALERLLAWKADRNGIDPLATDVYVNPVNGTQRSLANISGHRDLDATECPGGTFYATLPSLRRAVASALGVAASVPEAPSLTARKPTSGKGVQLNWTRPADGGSTITEYRILRLNSGSFVRIGAVSGSTLSFRDTSAKRGRSYTYVVRAVNAVGAGPYSNQASAAAR